MNPEDAKVRETVTTMNRTAEKETMTLGQIYRTETATLANDPTTAAAMPTYHEVCTTYVYLLSCFFNLPTAVLMNGWTDYESLHSVIVQTVSINLSLYRSGVLATIVFGLFTHHNKD